MSPKQSYQVRHKEQANSDILRDMLVSRTNLIAIMPKRDRHNTLNKTEYSMGAIGYDGYKRIAHNVMLLRDGYRFVTR